MPTAFETMIRQLAEGIDPDREARSKCLWPAPYNDDTPEALYRFLTECCVTWDDETKAEALIPNDLPHVGLVAGQWWYTRSVSRPLIIEKSRRLIVSWIVRGCELWSMGLGRETRIIGGLTYEKGAEHVWRIAHLYRAINKRRPEWNLKPARERGGLFDAMQFEMVILPNGSIVKALNQESESVQGSGYSGVCLEENSYYKSPRGMFAQSCIVLGGRMGTGHVVSINNSALNPEFTELTKPSAVIYNNDRTWHPAI